MNRPENLVVAMAWYRPEQWGLLRALSADGDKLEETYEAWLECASGKLRELQARGLQVRKVEVEVGALVRWCESQGRAVDGDARAQYAAQGLGRIL